jgi:predicted patatin/cPLA2 family phospholipase
MKAIVPFLILALVFAGCGHGVVRDPVPDALVDAVEPFGRAGLREWGDALPPEKVAAFISAATAGMTARYGPEIAAGRTPRADYLALSGGGQYGAFGAGILDAWARSGTRPVFAGVSGISTGAIIAPFAFLGPEYDATLREIYSEYDTAQLIEDTVFSGLISGMALSDTTRYAGIIAKYITPEILEKIAAEHRKGRLLFIGTTNLDAGRPVIWNVGAIAASGEPGALALVRDLIRASSAIPVAFPPIFVKVMTPDGREFDEMHVDGGASSQVTFISPEIPIAEATRRALGRNIDRRLWVIVNNDLEPPHSVIDPRIAPIGQAAVSSLIRGSGVGDLYRLDKIAERDEIAYRATWIPARTPCPDPVEDFDRAFMKCLYDYAGDYFRSGALWTDEPPFFAATLPPAPDARP